MRTQKKLLANWECEISIDDGEPETHITDEEGKILYTKAEKSQKVMIRPIKPADTNTKKDNS